MVNSAIVCSQNLNLNRVFRKSKFRISRALKILIASNVALLFLTASESAADNPAATAPATSLYDTPALAATVPDSQSTESTEGTLKVPTTSDAASPNSKAVRVNLAELQGSRVINLQKQEVGEVEDVVLDEHGQFVGLVVRLTDRLSVVAKSVFVSAAEIELTGQVVIWRTQMSGEELEALPDYDDDLVSQSVY